jgi:xanthine dehydrogenase accessory factor
MRFWLHRAAEALERGEAAMLVHVAELKGSGPRESGAQMLVTESDLAGTIGGGELERVAMFKARELLPSGRAGLARLFLGPQLNQCCGGSVMLAFEPFAPADLAWLKKLMRTAEEPAALFRTVLIDETGGLRRDWAADEEGSDFAAALTSTLRGGRSAPSEATASFGRGSGSFGSAPPSRNSRASSLRDDASNFDLPSRGRLEVSAAPPGATAGSASNAAPAGPGHTGLAVEIRERVNPPAQPLWLFGAGHVGRALVPALHPLGFAITWIDGRAGQFPEPALPGVKQLALAIPELAVDEAPPGAHFLVMTHSHPLDEAICEAVLRRDDFAYLGLIGSATKRASFVKRLGAAGISAARLNRLTCPIGLPGIKNKEPAAIAASVAADLLVRREGNLLSVESAGAHEH